MAYQTYTTKALVCGVFNRNTADRSYLLFTREAGMLYADAKSVREERSRQRYALQDFSLVRVSLVKGKRTWKIGSIEALKSYYHLAVDKAARGSITSLFRLLRRFLKGEEASHTLFDYVIVGLDELINEQPEREFMEMVVQVRVLAWLGYVDGKALPPGLADLMPSEITGHYSPALHKTISQLYTQAVSVSHL